MLQKEIGLIETEESGLQDRKSKLGKRLREEEFSAITVQEKLLVLEPLSQKLARARKLFLSVADKAHSKDVTIRRQEVLEKRAKKLLLNLQRLCGHRLILEYDGHEGSYSHDYDDKYPGSHVCVVCGFSERSQSCKEQLYAVLAPNEMRLVKRDLRKGGRTTRSVFFNEPELVSVEQIQNMFLASAGLLNLNIRFR